MRKRFAGGILLLVALEFGLCVAAAFFAFLRASPSEMAVQLTAPARWISSRLGAVLGWNEHIISHDPLGLWIQLFLIALCVSIITLGITTIAQAPTPKAVAASSWSGIIATLAPWIVFWVLAEPFPGWPTTVMEYIFLLVLLGTPAAAAYLARQFNSDSTFRNAFLLVVLLNLSLWLVARRGWPPYSDPLFWASLGTSLLLGTVWFFSVELARVDLVNAREPG
jgi:hypothetical protein